MTNYKHGAYGELGTSVAQSAQQSETVLVYAGTAPVNLIKGYKERKLTNYPVKLVDWGNSQRTAGYSENWEAYTLCEAMAAHFDNKLGNIGPIYVINVLDPDIHRKAEQTKQSVTFTNGRAEFVSDTIILDTLLLADLVKDVDYSIDYNFTKNSVIISSLKDDEPIAGTKEAAFYEVDPQKIGEADIIGGITSEGEYSGLSVLDLFYQETNQVPDLILAPRYSELPKVYNAMVRAAQAINGHWQDFVLADLPIEDANGAVDTIEKAKAWKKSKAYNSERAKSFWPQSIDDATGRIYHNSTLAAVEFLRADSEHDGIPMQTCSNKAVPITRQYFGKNSKNRGFDQQTANGLNQVGISTTVFWDGKMVLWGGHTDAYLHGMDVDPRTIFDTYMRTLFYCINNFQKRQGKTIDKPFNVQKKDSILNLEQARLDTLVGKGALLDGAKIMFLASENSTTDMMNGDFMFDIPVTTTPQAKSLTARVYYTDKGLRSLVEEV